MRVLIPYFRRSCCICKIYLRSNTENNLLIMHFHGKCRCNDVVYFIPNTRMHKYYPTSSIRVLLFSNLWRWPLKIIFVINVTSNMFEYFAIVTVILMDTFRTLPFLGLDHRKTLNQFQYSPNKKLKYDWQKSLKNLWEWPIFEP